MKRVLVVAAVCAAMATPPHVAAAPVYEASADDGARIVLHDEPCALAEVSNLPRRATWHEKDGKVYRGCWGPNPQAGVVVAFFLEDRTVALIPMRVLRRVQAT